VRSSRTRTDPTLNSPYSRVGWQPPSHGTGSLHNSYKSISFVLLTITAIVYTAVFPLFSLGLPSLSVGQELVEELDTRQMTVDMYPVVTRCQ
jgi:hypothetical protein